MKKLLLTAVLFSSLVIAQAQSFIVNFEPEGGGGRTGTGSGTLTLAGSDLTFNNITWSGISGTYTVSHIHGPTAVPLTGTTGVLYDMQPFLTLDPGNQSGSYNGTLNMVPQQSGAYTVSQQIDDMIDGRWYINVHSSPDFGGGEIRAFIIVPEPSTFALAGLGLGALVLGMRRKK